MSKPLLSIEELSVKFETDAGSVQAVDNVSLSVSEGETLAIVGESGSGKSVTALSILQLLGEAGRIEGGRIWFKNRDLVRESVDNIRQIRGDQIAMIFQEPMSSLNPVLTIGKQVAEPIWLHRKESWDSAYERAGELLKRVSIPDAHQRLNDYPHQFSGGMRQRVMIAMALQCNPSLLIADEPTTALDVTIQAQILDLMMDLKDKRKDAAILLITHDLAVIAETCDRVIVMYGGVIQEIAPIEELFKNPVHPYTKALMDSIPKMDLKAKRLKALKGMVPSILELDDGCKLCSRFDPEECACKGTKVEPDLIEISKGHFARVHQDLITQ